MKRDLNTLPLNFTPELIIDNFAGGGGASTGIEMALGRAVNIAINHDGEALAMHHANHPTTQHYREDVFLVHPGFVTRQQPIGLAWFSPDCKHHSKAKGGKPREQKIRGLAWVTLKWAAFQMPRCIALENVEEFQDWGPLDEHGKPIKPEKGRTFRAFVDALSTGLDKNHPDLQEIYDALGADFPIERLFAGLGYKVEWRTLRACDYGTPTIRKRLFMFARRDGLPIVWPTPTHGDPKSEAVKAGKLQPWRTAAECIDWSIPCPSIFERKRPLKDATLRRIAKGIMRFVVNAAEPFIVSCAHSDESPSGVKRWGQGIRDINQPLQTVLASGNGAALVVPHMTKFRSASTGSAITEPMHTVTAGGTPNPDHQSTGNVHGIVETVLAPILTEHANASTQRNFNTDEPLRTQCAQVKGGHFALVSAMLAKHYGGVTGTTVEVPFGTVTTADHHSVVTSNLIKLRGDNVGQPTDAPLATISAGGLHHAEVRAFLIKYYSEGSQHQDPREPMHTIPCRDRIGLVTIKGEDYAIVDIGMRMLTPRELARAQGFPDTYILEAEHNGKPLSKSAQVRMIGNSVCPPLAKALVKANFTHELTMKRVA